MNEINGDDRRFFFFLNCLYEWIKGWKVKQQKHSSSSRPLKKDSLKGKQFLLTCLISVVEWFFMLLKCDEKRVIL